MSDQISTPPGGDVTRITASLPSVDMEISRHDDTAAGAEAVTITLRARPGFEAMAQSLLPSAMMMPALMGGSGMAANPMAAFSALMGPMAALTGTSTAQTATGAATGSSDPLGMAEAMGQWQKMMQQAWAPMMESWGAMMGGAMMGSAMPNLGSSNPFAQMMAQMAGVPLCAAGAKPKG